MATIKLLDSGKEIKDAAEVAKYLAKHGIFSEVWPAPPAWVAQKQNLTDEEKQKVLDAYKPQLENEKTKRGYVFADVIAMSSATPNLDVALAKFDKLHHHTEDEVRYIADGEGVFGFDCKDGHQFLINVSAGDYIIIPAFNYHWFFLTEKKTIKAIRLFKNNEGWVPVYKEVPAAQPAKA